MHKVLLIVLLAGGLAACDRYPRDPQSSLQEAKQGGLRVGVMDAPPWSKMDAGQVTGREVELLRDFADSIGTRVQWVTGSEEELMRILESHELHVVIGGLTTNTPWKKHVGLTNVYLKEDVVFCSTDSELVPETVKNLPIGVEKGALTVAEVKKKGGVPVSLNSVAGYEGLVAVSETEVEHVACRSATSTLVTRKHVLAIPKGENALLMALEEYLNAAGY